MARYAATRVIGLAALCGIAALGLASLGGSVASGARHATMAVSTSVSFAVDLRVQVPEQYAAELRANGQADFVHHAVEASVTVPSLGLHASRKGNAGTLPGTRPLSVHAEWVGGHGYMSVPSSMSALVGGAQALSLPVSASTGRKFDAELTQSAVALTYARLLLSELTQPQQQHRVGARTIGGVLTTGTEVDLTLTQLLKVIPGLSTALAKVAQSIGNETIPVTVWVDQQGRLVDVTMASAAKGNGASVSGTVQFSNYNALVSVTAPPASTVRPIPKNVQQLLKGLNIFGGSQSG